MLTGHNLIYFAPDKWDGLWRNRQQLMSVFARQNKVMFVERRLHVRPTLTDLRRGNWGLSDLLRSSILQVSENLFVFRYPVWAPVCGRFDQLTKIVRKQFIQNALQKLNMSQPIVWFSSPYMIDVIQEVPSARLRLYHIVDEYTAYSNHTLASRRYVEELEKQMMARVDAVIVVSQKLYESKLPIKANTYLVPNGVNYQAYSAALDDQYLPDDLKAIKCPRLGYIGLIGDKLNFRMLKELAEENPQWSLVLLGQVRVSKQADAWQALQMLPNVHHLGPVAVSQVQHYVKGFQVGLMPYVQNRHAENISPLKLYDYLAAGIPIASVDIPAAREFGLYIHLGDSTQNFIQAVRAALVDTTPERRQARRNVAAGHTWEVRVEQLSDLIQAQLTAKAQSNGAGRCIGSPAS